MSDNKLIAIIAVAMFAFFIITHLSITSVEKKKIEHENLKLRLQIQTNQMKITNR